MQNFHDDPRDVIGQRIVELWQTPWDYAPDVESCDLLAKLSNDVWIQLQLDSQCEKLVSPSPNTIDSRCELSRLVNHMEDRAPLPVGQEVLDVVYSLECPKMMTASLVLPDRQILTVGAYGLFNIAPMLISLDVLLHKWSDMQVKRVWPHY